LQFFFSNIVEEKKRKVEKVYLCNFVFADKGFVLWVWLVLNGCVQTACLLCQGLCRRGRKENPSFNH